VKGSGTLIEIETFVNRSGGEDVRLLRINLMSVRKVDPSMLQLWFSAAEAQLAMWTTLSLRVPMLLTGTMTAPERTRMISEKIEAAAESALDASIAVGKAFAQSPAALLSPAAGVCSAIAIMDAASKPYHRRLTANAHRLRRNAG
jgi:hypothetical protein